MRAHLLLLLAIGLLASVAHGKTVFRRADKISENFKQLDLAPEEIDPNVAPPQPTKVEDALDPEDVVNHNNVPTETAEDPIVDEEEESTSGSGVDEAANEVDAVIDEAVAAASPAFAGAAIEAPVPAPAPAAAAAAAAAASPATPAVAPTAKPVKDGENANGLSKFCKCKDSHCDCCRKFSLPLIPVNGPGCARISYLGNEKMSVSIKYGDITLASRTISSKNARPICVGLPGGYSKFCGRVYGLSKEKSDKSNFKACLGFELRAEDEVEAALRVSCFKFGPEGLRVAEAEPFPEPPKAEDDDDDDDIFGFAAGGDDEEDEEEDEYDAEDTEADDDDEDDDDDADDEVAAEPEDDDDEAPEDADYGGFSLAGLIDELDDDDDEPTAAANKPQAASSATPAADQTRAVAQSKDDKGTVGDAASVAAQEPSVEAAVAAVGADAVTAEPAPEATTVKGKKSKKSKKNKKKKAAVAETSEGGFAYEILNGILDFFN